MNFRYEGKASIHLLNKKLFAYYTEETYDKVTHVVRSHDGMRTYPDTPPEVAAGRVIALMSKAHALECISSKKLSEKLPKETIDAVKPLMVFI